MCEFAKEDVLTIARAVLNEWAEYSGGDYDCHHWCMFCMARTPDDLHYRASDIKHDIDCPVLVAQDVLTRQSE